MKCLHRTRCALWLGVCRKCALWLGVCTRCALWLGVCRSYRGFRQVERSNSPRLFDHEEEGMALFGLRWPYGHMTRAWHSTCLVSSKYTAVLAVGRWANKKWGEWAKLLTYLLSYLPTYLLSYLRTYLLTFLLSYFPTYFLTYLLAYLLSYLLTYLLTCLLACLLAWLLTYVLTYLLTSSDKLQLGFHSVAVVLAPVQTKQIRINIHKGNNRKHSTNNTKDSKYKSTYYQNTPTNTHPHITQQVKTTTVQDTHQMK